MKRTIIMAMAITLSVLCATAQVKTGNEIIDALASGWLDTDAQNQLEEMFSSYGVKVSVNNRIDTSNKYFITEYTFFDKEVYDYFNLEESKDGAIDGMLREAKRHDPSGDILRQLVSELNRTGWQLKIIAKYSYLEKGIIAKPKDFKKKAAKYK